MKRAKPGLLHLPFYEALESATGESELWHATSACLQTLRIVDVWRRTSRRRATVPARHLRAVSRYVQMAHGEVRSRLERALDAIASNDVGAKEVAARALLDQATALHLEMDWPLAIDICKTGLARLGHHMSRPLLLRVV